VTPPGSSTWIPRRLDKFIREASPLSLRAIRQAWSDGRIRVHVSGTLGQATSVRGLNHLIHTGDVIELDGQQLSQRTEHHAAILNKPIDVTSSARDPLGQQDLGRWLSGMPGGTFAVGRLDRETTGLLLFTSDGDLADAVLQPLRHTDKVYWLWLDEELTPDDPRLRAMVQPNPHFDCAKHVEVLHRSAHHVELALTLDQGKHHQIRRLCRALGLRLVHLHRRSIGPISLGDLPVGDVRTLGAAEVAVLWDAVGGRQRVRDAQIAALRRHVEKARRASQPDARLEAWLEAQAPEADAIVVQCTARS
jgi:23S rRNA pseudouridine2605 synthase